MFNIEKGEMEMNIIRGLAAWSTGGLVDPEALIKLADAIARLKKATDRIDAVSEACDVIYLAITAEANYLISIGVMNSWIQCMSVLTHVPEGPMLRCAIAKYATRNDGLGTAQERREITSILYEFMVGEAQAIQYLIIKSGGMATKSRVEDVLMVRHKHLDRMEAHELLNQIEFMNEPWFKVGPTVWTRSNVPEPQPKDYPEINGGKDV